jgi:hypothetical protein
MEKTLMANVVRNPREHPEAYIPDFSKPDPLVTFSTNDIAFEPKVETALLRPRGRRLLPYASAMGRR